MCKLKRGGNAETCLFSNFRIGWGEYREGGKNRYWKIGTKVKIIDSDDTFLIGVKGIIANPFTERVDQMAALYELELTEAWDKCEVYALSLTNNEIIEVVA